MCQPLKKPYVYSNICLLQHAVMWSFMKSCGYLHEPSLDVAVVPLGVSLDELLVALLVQVILPRCMQGWLWVTVLCAVCCVLFELCSVLFALCAVSCDLCSLSVTYTPTFCSPCSSWWCSLGDCWPTSAAFSSNSFQELSQEIPGNMTYIEMVMGNKQFIN